MPGLCRSEYHFLSLALLTFVDKIGVVFMHGTSINLVPIFITTFNYFFQVTALRKLEGVCLLNSSGRNFLHLMI